MAKSTAERFSTGSAPGKPRHTGHTCVFGGAPNAVLQPQKIFDARQQLRVDFETDDRFEHAVRGPRSDRNLKSASRI